MLESCSRSIVCHRYTNTVPFIEVRYIFSFRINCSTSYLLTPRKFCHILCLEMKIFALYMLSIMIYFSPSLIKELFARPCNIGLASCLHAVAFLLTSNTEEFYIPWIKLLCFNFWSILLWRWKLLELYCQMKQKRVHCLFCSRTIWQNFYLTHAIFVYISFLKDMQPR